MTSIDNSQIVSTHLLFAVDRLHCVLYLVDMFSWIILLVVWISSPNVKGECHSCQQLLSGVPNGFQKVTYTENKDLMQNPRRGFWTEMGTKTSNFHPLTVGDLNYRRNKYGLVVIQRMYTMDTFTSRELDNDFLSKIRHDMQTIRDARMTVVPRFCYVFENRNKSPYGDASKEWVLKHIKQLSAIFHEYTDVIDSVQTGFIGAWGEWYYTTYFGSPEERNFSKYPHTQGYSPQHIADRKQVVTALLDALPVEIRIQQRYPSWNRKLFGPDPPTLHDVETHTYKGRIGHHNDCFLANKEDRGTYSDGVEIDYPYLHEVTKYLPTGGETCEWAPSESERHKCPTAQHDMKYFHYTSINIGFYKPVYQDWQKGGCFNDIFRNMGYRLILKESILPSTAHVGGDLCFRIVLRNHGFAAPIRNWDVFFVLRKGSSHYAAHLTGLNMRLWLPGNNIVIHKTVHLPRSFATGTYETLLVFRDKRLHDHSDYNILMANDHVAERQNGVNNLQHKVLVTSGGHETLSSTCPGLAHWTPPAPSKYSRVISNVDLS